MTEGIGYGLLDIPSERAKLIDWLSEKIATRTALARYQTLAVAEIVVAIFANDLADAGAYRWLCDEICKTMADPDSWGFDEAEELALMRYVAHLVTASHGDCSECGRKIMANEQCELTGRAREGEPILTCTGCI